MEETYLIDVAKNGLLDTLMLDDLTQDATVTTADDKDFLGVRVRIHGKVGDHFLVATARNLVSISAFQKESAAHRDLRKLVTLGTLDHIVQDQNIAIVAALEYEDLRR